MNNDNNQDKESVEKNSKEEKKRLKLEAEEEGFISGKPGVIRRNVSFASFEWVESMIVAIIIVGICFTFFFRIITISGDSMYPNLHDGDRVFTTSLFGTPSKGDVVVLKQTAGLEQTIIKRVIATEGDTIYIDYNTGTVYVNGNSLDESWYLPAGTFTSVIKNTKYDLTDFSQGPLTVPKGTIFVLGDNRSVSLDSRYMVVGFVETKYIVGVGQFIVFPFDRMFKGVTNLDTSAQTKTALPSYS